MSELKLYMLLAGCRPKGRNTEQHDVFFGIGTHIKDLVPALCAFWPEAKKKIHLDAWRAVEVVDGYAVSIIKKEASIKKSASAAHLFFINLGGYKPDEFEEFHYKMIVAAPDKAQAIKKAKQTAFYQHTGFTEAPAHVDDKFGIDVDDILQIKDILPAESKDKYQIVLVPAAADALPDALHLGYMPFDSL